MNYPGFVTSLPLLLNIAYKGNIYFLHFKLYRAYLLFIYLFTYLCLRNFINFIIFY